MEFKEGWRIWGFGVDPFGLPQLTTQFANATYTLPPYWDGNRVMARCVLGCESPPGPDCRCGLRFYPHTGGFFDKVANRMAGVRADGFLRGNPAFWGTRILSYGTPVGPCYPDPKTGDYGAWRQYWRTGRYDVLALLAWPEYPMDALGARYGNVPVFTFGNDRSPAETLRWVASSVGQA